MSVYLFSLSDDGIFKAPKVFGFQAVIELTERFPALSWFPKVKGKLQVVGCDFYFLFLINKMLVYRKENVWRFCPAE